MQFFLQGIGLCKNEDDVWRNRCRLSSRFSVGFTDGCRFSRSRTFVSCHVDGRCWSSSTHVWTGQLTTTNHSLVNEIPLVEYQSQCKELNQPETFSICAHVREREWERETYTSTLSISFPSLVQNPSSHTHTPLKRVRQWSDLTQICSDYSLFDLPRSHLE